MRSVFLWLWHAKWFVKWRKKCPCLPYSPVIYIRRQSFSKGFRLHVLGLTTAFFFTLTYALLSHCSVHGRIDLYQQCCPPNAAAQGGSSGSVVNTQAKTTGGLDGYWANRIGRLHLTSRQTIWVLFVLIALTLISELWLWGLLILLLLTSFINDLTWSRLFLSQYLWGYFAGALLGIIYNDLVFLYERLFHSKASRIVFAYNTECSLNIIKTPILAEDIHSIPDTERKRTFESDDMGRWIKKKADTWLYDFDPKPVPSAPLTIAFVANPVFREDPGDTKGFADPIASNLPLFLRSVERALHSLSSNNALGKPEIWSRIRVVTLFGWTDKKRWDEVGMAQSYNAGLYEIAGYNANAGGQPVIDGESVNNMSKTAAETKVRYKDAIDKEIIKGRFQENLNADDLLKQTDMIFVLSAASKYTRATATFADWFESGLPAKPDNPVLNPGDPEPPKNTFRIESTAAKSNDDATDSNDDSAAIEFKHRFYWDNPGRAAVNVLEACSTTYIHEFAHGFSDPQNGVIVDEYFDRMEVAGLPDPPENPRWFEVNRRDRNKKDDGRFSGPIPAAFRIYQFSDETAFTYPSELTHPTAEENWSGFSPERITPYSHCLMDRPGLDNQFDKLLAKFIYDRLWIKANRPK